MTSSQQESVVARKSAFVVGGVLLGIAAWNAWKGRPHIWMPASSIGFLLFLIGQFWRTGALQFHRGWMRFAHALGWVNSRILLSLMFYGIMTPYGLVMRLAGRNPLRRRGPAQPTYWIPRKHPRQRREQFERLF